MKETTAQAFERANKAAHEFILLFCKEIGIERFVIWLENKLDYKTWWKRYNA